MSDGGGIKGGTYAVNIRNIVMTVEPSEPMGKPGREIGVQSQESLMSKSTGFPGLP